MYLRVNISYLHHNELFSRLLGKKSSKVAIHLTIRVSSSLKAIGFWPRPRQLETVGTATTIFVSINPCRGREYFRLEPERKEESLAAVNQNDSYKRQDKVLSRRERTKFACESRGCSRRRLR